MDGPKQHVIVYDKPGERNVVFDTAYTDGQVKRGILRCAAKHGRTSNV